MKIAAKNIKVGMTVSWGVVTLTVESIKVGFQKNGKEIRIFEGSAFRSNGKYAKATHYSQYDITVKSETKLTAI